MYALFSGAALAAAAISPSFALPMPWGYWHTHTGDSTYTTSAAPVVPVVGPSGGIVGDGTTSTAPVVPQPSSGSTGREVNAVSSGGESHKITLVNKCGQGQAVFQDGSGKVYTGSTTYSGRLNAGLAWISGAYGCGDKDGTNCGDVEFTLTNNGQSSINYSLQANGGQAHTYKYPMSFTTTDCTLLPSVPGQCTGSDQTSCPGAFVGTDTTGGTVYSCTDVQNMELIITFC